MRLCATASTTAPADKAWAVLFHDFGKNNVWASNISSTSFPQEKTPSIGDVRLCDTSAGHLRETITILDPVDMRLSYRAEGMPIIIRNAINHWTVRRSEDGSVRVETCLELTLLPILAPLLQRVLMRPLQRASDEALEELVYFLENNQPHPRDALLRLKPRSF